MSQGLPLYSFAGTAILSTTCLEAVTTDVLSLSSGGWNCKIKTVAGLVPPEGCEVASPPDWWFASHLLFIYLFYWLCQVLVAACGIWCPNLRDQTWGTGKAGF